MGSEEQGASGKTVISKEVIEVGQPAGLSKVTSLPSAAVVPNEDEVRDDEIGFHVTEVVVTSNNVVTGVEQVIEECEVGEDTVSIPGKKRKILDEVEILNKASTPKKALKRQIYDLIDTNKRLKKKLRISQKKTRRLKRKIDMLASVVDDLKAKNFISSGCAELLQATFSAVPRESMKRLVSQRPKRILGLIHQSSEHLP